MSRLNIEDRVYAEQDGTAAYEKPVVCAWFALCTNLANGLRSHPHGEIPICQRCDDKIERLSR